MTLGVAIISFRIIRFSKSDRYIMRDSHRINYVSGRNEVIDLKEVEIMIWREGAAY